MTKQEYYDLLVKSAYDGTFPSMESVNSLKKCLYRKINGDGKVHKCAIGILIPDDIYSPEFETGNFDHVLKRIMTCVPTNMNAVELLVVQGCHDNTAHEGWNPANFIGRINSLRCFEGVVKQKPK